MSRAKRYVVVLCLLAATIIGGGLAVAHATTGHAHAGTPVTVSGGRGECAWRYQWDVNTGASHEYTWVEWTADPCNYRIQARGEFTAPVASHYTKFSGWVQSVGIRSQVSANGVFDSIDHAAEHIYYPTPKTYSNWHTYWNAP